MSRADGWKNSGIHSLKNVLYYVYRRRKHRPAHLEKGSEDYTNVNSEYLWVYDLWVILGFFS